MNFQLVEFFLNEQAANTLFGSHFASSWTVMLGFMVTFQSHIHISTVQFLGINV
ncbi:hypothetical protein RchiOBHm_Chr4g0441761 [Rosa chinensis]|uniref:Uncharacterized protein n=1 Tax=Rosa chinensis TaxID=74649 RepID=A0A2P6R3C6_ROSCH|nr:hypothetical protein RchiOBHm_Chr4g0441761 [Rosa chinensis]